MSTAYAHVSNHNTTIEERFYSVPTEPEDVIKAAEEMEDAEFKEVSKKFVFFHLGINLRVILFIN